MRQQVYHRVPLPALLLASFLSIVHIPFSPNAATVQPFIRLAHGIWVISALAVVWFVDGIAVPANLKEFRPNSVVVDLGGRRVDRERQGNTGRTGACSKSFIPGGIIVPARFRH